MWKLAQSWVLGTHRADNRRPIHADHDRPLVRDHEETGRTALLIASHIEKLTGLGTEESTALVADLTARATTADNVYAHVWRPGDLLLWDNRCVMHRATHYEMDKYPRDVRTARLVDVAELEAA